MQVKEYRIQSEGHNVFLTPQSSLISGTHCAKVYCQYDERNYMDRILLLECFCHSNGLPPKKICQKLFCRLPFSLTQRLH